jgi:hypothetical protein
VQNDEPLAPALPEDLTTRQVAPARDYRLTANKTVCTFDASGPGVAVLSEAFVRDGVRALVNGQPAPVFRLNHFLRGVALPAAGTYVVEWEYWPRVLTPALWVSGVSLGLMLMTGIGLVIGSRPRPPRRAVGAHREPAAHTESAIETISRR